VIVTSVTMSFEIAHALPAGGMGAVPAIRDPIGLSGIRHIQVL
jgi:hypothetical protein